MLGYITLGTNDLDRALAFYDALFAPMGGKRVMDVGNGTLFGFAQGPMVGVLKPHNGEAACIGNGSMAAFNVGTPERVAEIHALALANGGTDEGAPGPRGTSGFNAGYFRDLDGNKLCAFCMGG